MEFDKLSDRALSICIYIYIYIYIYIDIHIYIYIYKYIKWWTLSKQTEALADHFFTSWLENFVFFEPSECFILQQVKEILFLKAYFFSTIQIYSWIAKLKWKKVDLISDILGQLPSSIESPGQAFPPPVGWGFVHDLVLTFLFPPHKPEPQPLH